MGKNLEALALIPNYLRIHLPRVWWHLTISFSFKLLKYAISFLLNFFSSSAKHSSRLRGTASYMAWGLALYFPELFFIQRSYPQKSLLFSPEQFHCRGFLPLWLERILFFLLWRTLYSLSSANEATCRFFKTEAIPRSIRSPSIVLICK